MSSTELCYLSATDALELFRAKKLSPVEYMQAQISRAGEVEPSINKSEDWDANVASGVSHYMINC